MASLMIPLAVARANTDVGVGAMTQMIKAVINKYGSGASVQFIRLNGGHNIFHISIPKGKDFSALLSAIGPANNDFLQCDKFVVYKWIPKAPTPTTEKAPVDISRIGYRNMSSTWGAPLDPSIQVLKLKKRAVA
jgi:hypothetical protein